MALWNLTITLRKNCSRRPFFFRRSGQLVNSNLDAAWRFLVLRLCGSIWLYERVVNGSRTSRKGKLKLHVSPYTLSHAYIPFMSVFSSVVLTHKAAADGRLSQTQWNLHDRTPLEQRIMPPRLRKLWWNCNDDEDSSHNTETNTHV